MQTRAKRAPVVFLAMFTLYGASCRKLSTQPQSQVAAVTEPAVAPDTTFAGLGPVVIGPDTYTLENETLKVNGEEFKDAFGNKTGIRKIYSYLPPSDTSRPRLLLWVYQKQKRFLGLKKAVYVYDLENKWGNVWDAFQGGFNYIDASSENPGSEMIDVVVSGGILYGLQRLGTGENLVLKNTPSPSMLKGIFKAAPLTFAATAFAFNGNELSVVGTINGQQQSVPMSQIEPTLK